MRARTHTKLFNNERFSTNLLINDKYKSYLLKIVRFENS